VAFVSNSSFIDSRTYDGFRKLVADEFSEIWIIDLKGNARTSGERRRREGGNVFNDQIRVGIAVYFCVKKKGAHGCRIRYESIRDYAKSDEKREFLHIPISTRAFSDVVPDKNYNWINQTDNDFETLIPIGTRDTKSAKKPAQERAVFKLFSLGVVTARDDWVYAYDRGSIRGKVRFLVDVYNADLAKLGGKGSGKRIDESLDYSIKWTRAVKNDLRKGVHYHFTEKMIIDALYRPFVKMHLYFSQQLNEMQYQLRDIFGWTHENVAVLIGAGAKAFSALATSVLPDYHVNGDSICFARYRFADDGHCMDNITDWALDEFRRRYERGKHRSRRLPGEAMGRQRSITKEAIFHYVYGVLHDPIYREKYALNLKREFPRIPFYADFWKWAEWGEKLMALHIGYEAVEPWALERIDAPDEKSRKAGLTPKPMLKANKEAGNIQLDSETQLTGVPPQAWTYRLGNRSALEWILDQYKEKTPKDPTIREKFNTYRFADHKEKVVDLLKRVTRVSVETMKIVEAMGKEKR